MSTNWAPLPRPTQSGGWLGKPQPTNVKSIAKTSTSNKHNTPWFNDDCKKLYAYVRLPYVNSISKPTTTNLNDFKLLRAKTRKLIKETKKKTWQKCQPTGLLCQDQLNLEDD